MPAPGSCPELAVDASQASRCASEPAAAAMSPLRGAVEGVPLPGRPGCGMEVVACRAAALRLAALREAEVGMGPVGAAAAGLALLAVDGGAPAARACGAVMGGCCRFVAVGACEGGVAAVPGAEDGWGFIALGSEGPAGDAAEAAWTEVEEAEFGSAAAALLAFKGPAEAARLASAATLRWLALSPTPKGMLPHPTLTVPSNAGMRAEAGGEEG